MDYISVKEASAKFGISERRIQKLCESCRIAGAERISGVWIIPSDATKPLDERMNNEIENSSYLSIQEVCDQLGVSIATGRNWVKLGKLIPCEKKGRALAFDADYIETLKSDIKSGKKQALKSRRNKKFVSGNSLYNSYVSSNCCGIKSVTETLDLIATYSIELSDKLLRLLIANAAVQMLSEAIDGYKVNLEQYIRLDAHKSSYDRLIQDVLGEARDCKEYLEKYKDLFDVEYSFESNEDVLGLLYISCLNFGNRKATGSYYTPTNVVRKLISNLKMPRETGKVLDPCCGTGNFLLQLPETVHLEDIYGNDIDELSVMVSRINMALKFKPDTMDTIIHNITVSDYLTEYKDKDFEYIIGNPPWGYNFEPNQTVILDMMYEAANGSKTESYDVFTEKAVNSVKLNGVVSFVLPEAILNVKSHQPVRQIMVERTSIQYLDYLGNAFDGVQCPCIILQIKNTGIKMSTIGMEVISGEKKFTIQGEREISSELFSFTMSDDEYEIISRLKSMENVLYLKDNATFALGIVTGNNKEYISSEKTDENEMILKGSDLLKYRFVPSNNYIKFLPETFQQIAPTEYYRAKEKLLYRFICNQLVFAYDDHQTLSLNSCNVLIPSIDSMSCKYIMAILNSRVAQFYFKKMFNSVKILRSHIEQIPLPIATKDQQNEIEKKVAAICGENDKDAIDALYNELDLEISKLFELSDSEYQIIFDSMDKENNFLV